MRFKKQHIANFSSTTADKQDITNFSFTAYYSSHNHLPIFDLPTVFAASSDHDILHYGAMQHYLVHLHFKADIHHEVCGLFSTDTVEIAKHSFSKDHLFVWPRR
jgi:hypothetical protein